MIFALISAFLAPIFWSLMNVLDKFVISQKVQNPLSFAAVAGVVNILYGIILASMLNWSNIGFQHVLSPVITGALLGLQFYVYFAILKHEDVSHFIGLMFVYPAIVALLAFLFLHEKISAAGYMGVAIIVIGASLLSLRVKHVNLGKSAWMIVIATFLSAGYEFFAKIATTSIPELNGIAISCMSLGFTVLPALCHKKTRSAFPSEFLKIKWALLSEALTFLAVFSIYFAMKGLKATFVSSISAIQPLAVIVFERIVHEKYGRITKDMNLFPKLAAILLIVTGIVVLCISEML
jgi:uncharacterized membrane protein